MCLSVPGAKPRLLLIEDDPVLHRRLARYLGGYYRIWPTTHLSGAQAILAESEAPYDVVLLDRMLPDGDGLDLIPTLQTIFPQTKICVMSSKDTPAEEMRGFKYGADDYVPKPLQPALLASHLAALCRRSKLLSKNEWHCGPLRLNPAARTVSYGPRRIRLSPRETEILQVFFHHPYHDVATHDLMQVLWHHGRETSLSAVHVLVQRLRRKLIPFPARLQSIYGYGYQLVIQEQELHPTPGNATSLT